MPTDPRQDLLEQAPRALLGTLNGSEALLHTGHVDRGRAHYGSSREWARRGKRALIDQGVEREDQRRAARIVDDLVRVEARAARAAPILQERDVSAREESSFERGGEA